MMAKWSAVVMCLLAVGLTSAAVAQGWFEFVIAEPAEGSVVNVAAYNDRPAGADGFVTVSNGHFVDGRGQRIRFLGTNLTFSRAFPDKHDAPTIARRMAALGINCVRFHHMDAHHRPLGIWDPDYKDHQHIDAEQLDRLDWMIYQLKQHGIYANINLHVSRTLGKADGFDNVDGLPRYSKGVGYFEPRMIELQKKYARDLLIHVNPYTGTAYVDEPCIAMVELTNEDSALRFAYGTTMHNLPEPYRGRLQRLWMDWLRAEYQTSDALRVAWDEGSEPLGEEMLRNADFAQGTKQWQLEAPKPAEGMMETIEDPQVGKALHAKLSALGTQVWHFQVHQVGHTLADGRLYTASFRARADPPRTIRVGTRYDVADWRFVGLSAGAEADEQWREFSFTFRADEPLAEHTRLSFNHTNKLGDVWLADVSLRPGGQRGLAVDQSLEAGNVEAPVSSAPVQARTDWMAFFIDIERRYTTDMYEFLKNELGLHALVIDTQATYGGAGGVWRESQMDYLDVHAYWQHPRFPGRPWDGNNWYIPNTPMTAALGADTLTKLAQYRVAAKPYTVSEYHHPAPNDYRAECMPMLGAFAALQDWDGIFQFCYGAHPDDWREAAITGYFNMATDPAELAMFPVTANLFRRGDVEAASGLSSLLVPRGRVADLVRRYGSSMTGVWAGVDAGHELALVNRLAVEWSDGDEVDIRTSPRVADDRAGQVSWTTSEEDGGRFLVDTPKTKVALGPIAGEVVELGSVRIEVEEMETGWVAVALTAMDDRPIADSERMLLVVMSKVENQQMGWSKDRRTVKGVWGRGPTIAEGVEATVTLAGRDDLSGYALDGTGTRTGKLAGDEEGVFHVGPEHETVWYEIAGR